jgi:AhpD family alkylhydroperoxidase
MPRIRPLAPNEAPEEMKSAYERNVRNWGQVLSNTGIYAYRPTIQAGRQAMAEAIEESGLLSARLRSLIQLRVASLVGCHLCMELNSVRADRAGASALEIAAAHEAEPGEPFTEAEQAALELADAASIIPVHIPDELWDRVAKHYNERELVELAAVIAYENFLARFNEIFDVQGQGLYQPGAVK